METTNYTKGQRITITVHSNGYVFQAEILNVGKYRLTVRNVGTGVKSTYDLRGNGISIN